MTVRYLMYVLLPAWFVPGIADYVMHRRTRIERASGLGESGTHALMMAERYPCRSRERDVKRSCDACGTPPPLAGSPWPRASPTPWACSPRPPDLLRSSSLCGGQLEDKRDAGTARAGERLHLVRDSPRYPQAVTGQFRKRIQQGRGIRGCDQVAIVDLAVQCPRQLPYSQSSHPAAM